MADVTVRFRKMAKRLTELKNNWIWAFFSAKRSAVTWSVIFTATLSEQERGFIKVHRGMPVGPVMASVAGSQVLGQFWTMLFHNEYLGPFFCYSCLDEGLHCNCSLLGARTYLHCSKWYRTRFGIFMWYAILLRPLHPAQLRYYTSRQCPRLCRKLAASSCKWESCFPQN